MRFFCQCWRTITRNCFSGNHFPRSRRQDLFWVRKERRCIVALALSFGIVSAAAAASVELPSQHTAVLSESVKPDPTRYYWKTTPVGNTAQLVTLFCGSCGTASDDVDTVTRADADKSGGDVPLVSVLRDTLGDRNPRNDRLLYVWLLSYIHPNAAQYILSAMPFLYWRIGEGSSSASHTVSPLLNLTTPERSLVFKVGRQILQSSLLDASATPIRAVSRAYRGNESDYQRLRLEEAAAYLRKSPISDGDNGLSRSELDTVIARLELHKRLLGGLVTGRNVAQVGAEAGYAQERIRSRDWEVLRQCAERTGLIFEPLKLAGSTAKYGILWFSPGAVPPAPGQSLRPIWKLLNIRNPWTDRRLRNWHGPAYIRTLDENGSLLPAGSSGVTHVRLIPLGVYSLDYPTAPLLLVDFRNGLHIRRHEMTQRAINDVTAGIIGISHFSNWYYYAAADLYDFVVSRHGSAMNETARLDCYSQFRAAVALDQKLDPRLRDQIQRRMSSLAFNPLEGSPGKALQLARAHYQVLLAEAQDGRLSSRIDKERRGELANFGASRRARFARIVLHGATFGTYTHRVKKSDENLTALDHERRILYQLSFLDSLVDAGTAPEVAYAPGRIQASIAEVGDLIPRIRSAAVRTHAIHTLQQLQEISQSSDLQANCATALASLKDLDSSPVQVAAGQGKRPSAAMVALLSSMHTESLR